jgi:hypothetical protein
MASATPMRRKAMKIGRVLNFISKLRSRIVCILQRSASPHFDDTHNPVSASGPPAALLETRASGPVASIRPWPDLWIFFPVSASGSRRTGSGKIAWLAWISWAKIACHTKK